MFLYTLLFIFIYIIYILFSNENKYVKLYRKRRTSTQAETKILNAFNTKHEANLSNPFHVLVESLGLLYRISFILPQYVSAATETEKPT